MDSYYSTLSGWLIPFSRAMEAAGLDSEEIFSQCNINPKLLDQESRLAADKFSNTLSLCRKKLNTKDFSILVAKQFHPGMFHALGYAMMSSNTLHDALERIAQYKRVVSNTCSLEIKEIQQQIVLEMYLARYEDSGRYVLDQGLVELFLATLVEFARELVNKKVSPVKVQFTAEKPNFDTQYLNDYFQCDITFGAEYVALVFEKDIADTKLISGNALITQTHEKILNGLLARIDKDDLTYQIKNKIYSDLPLGAPSQTDMAQFLGMSLRNLQRRLHDKDTSYKYILESTRKKLALDYIQQQHLSLNEISYLVGFSSVGNFNRAFKRWTEKAPGEYRSSLPEFEKGH
jgi:AraC-like DNA-binding protein